MIKLKTSELDLGGNRVKLTLENEHGVVVEGSLMLEELDNLIVDMHKVRLGLAVASKADMGVEIATKSTLQAQEKKIRSILIPNEVTA
jgi:hypothetical protein